MTLRLPFAIIVTSIIGAAVFCALLPWGDPCSVATSPERLCSKVTSASQQQLANAVFVVICLLVGLGAGSIAKSRGYVAGTMSVPLSAILGGFTGHHLYAVNGPWFHWEDQGAYLPAALFIGLLAMLGFVGALTSRWIATIHRGNA
jgi:hypothetical protein